MTSRLTGDTVRIAGLSGRFPDALRVGHVALRDPEGDYTTITNLALDWSPLELVHRRVVIDRLAADDVDVMRVPGGQSSGGSISLPVPVTLRELQVDRLEVGAAVAGTAAAVAVSGSGEANSLSDFHVALEVHQLGGSGRYTVDATSDANTIQATLHASEAARGLVAGIAGLPDLGAITVDGTVQGPRDAFDHACRARGWSVARYGRRDGRPRARGGRPNGIGTGAGDAAAAGCVVAVRVARRSRARRLHPAGRNRSRADRRAESRRWFGVRHHRRYRRQCWPSDGRWADCEAALAGAEP